MFPLTATAFTFLGLGAPVAFALGIAGLVYLLMTGAHPGTLASQMFATLILITVPILLPILNAMNADLIGFAIILVINMELAVISPPIGLNLFVISGISRVPVVDVFRGTLPFAAVLFLMMIAMIFIPGFVF